MLVYFRPVERGALCLDSHKDPIPGSYYFKQFNALVSLTLIYVQITKHFFFFFNELILMIGNPSFMPRHGMIYYYNKKKGYALNKK